MLALSCLTSSALLLGGELRHLYLRHTHPERKTQSALYSYARATCGALTAGFFARGLALTLQAPLAVALVAGDVMTTALLSMLTAFARQAEQSCQLIPARKLAWLYLGLQGVLWGSCVALIALRLAPTLGHVWYGGYFPIHVARGVECLFYILVVGGRTIYLFRHLESFVVPTERKRQLRKVWTSLTVLCGVLAIVAVLQLLTPLTEYNVDWGTTVAHLVAGLYLQRTIRPIQRKIEAWSLTS